MPERSAERKNVHPQLEVISGPMFSGKTDELIRRLVREQIAKVEIQLFKPSIDNRYGDDEFTHSHSDKTFPATLVNKDNPREIIEKLKSGVRVVGIEEVQFFGSEIVEVCEELVAMDKRVVVAGLPSNFRGEPFGSMPALLAKAEEIDSLSAICMVCGDNAYFTQRIKIIDGKRIPANYDDPLILVGAERDYEARCRQHHEIPGKPAPKSHDG